MSSALPRIRRAAVPGAGGAVVPSAGPRARFAAVPLTGLVAALAWAVRSGGFHTDPVGLGVRYAVCWALFGLALAALRRVPGRRAGALVLSGGVAVALTGLAAPPATSTDAFRYAWDGRVQAAAISPYDHAPADPALTRLRGPWLFPSGTSCAGPDKPAVTPAGTCTRINRPQVHTIYPPVAEAYFLVVHTLSPPGARLLPFQVGGAVLAIGITAVLLALLRRRGLDVRHAAVWAWCPAVPLEGVNNAHVDTLAVLLTAAALFGLSAAGARARTLGGALLGLAIAAKLLPAVVLPAACAGLLAGRPFVPRLRAAAIPVATAGAVVALTYLPYVWASRSSVLGYLGGYAREEGYDDPAAGSRYALLRLVLPDRSAAPAVAALTLVAVVYVLRRGDARRPWAAATLVAGTAFLLTTPGYPWYALLLVALAAVEGRSEWAVVAAAGEVAYLAVQATPVPAVPATWAYALAGVTVAVAPYGRTAWAAWRAGPAPAP